MSKIRVIMNGVSFYTTPAAIKRGVGDFSLINTAIQLCYEEMGRGAGLCKTYSIYDSKMKKTDYTVQLSRVY
jgi:hypothetical protein